MCKKSNHKNQLLHLAAGGIFSVALLNNAFASEGAAEGLVQEIKESECLLEEIKNHGITAGAWVNAGVTYNTNDPEDNFNGPVTFGDRSGEFQLNQLNVYLEKAIVSEGDKWDLGARFDVMFGSDAIFTQAYGAFSNGGGWDLNLLNDRFYNIAVPNAYLQVYAPFGNGLTIKAGHFYTPIGYEVVTAPDNFFYSHAYTMQYGEPFTHTGFQGNYTIDKNWAVMGGVVTGSETGGWDGNFSDQLGNWSGLMGATWTSNDEGTSLNVSGTYGSTSETNSAAWSMYSVVFQHNITDKAHLVLQHDHGFADGNARLGTTDAEWYGVNSHLYYDIKDDLKIGIRGEWFRDHNNARVFSPARAVGVVNTPGGVSYYEVTAGVTWKPKTWLSLRPNIRYDWTGDSIKAFDAGNRDDQLLFSTDVTVIF
jgi:hypothetical protein